jgi:hypothetical protein
VLEPLAQRLRAWELPRRDREDPDGDHECGEAGHGLLD